MHYILLEWEKSGVHLHIFFALVGVLVALLGIGTFTQVNSITESIQKYTQVNPAITALILSIL